MQAFNDLLLEIYRLAQNAPPAEFQTQAMDKMREAVDFDSAFWATGVIEPGIQVTAHTYFLYRQPQEMMENWVRINKNDEVAFEAFRQQGTTLNLALCGPEWQTRFTPEVREHVNRYGMAHTLNTVIAEPVLQIWTGVGIYRADPRRPYNEEARSLVQNLLPHLSEAWNISRFAFMDAARNNGAPSNQGRAICDIGGVLYNADRNFADLMLAEWCDWKGPRLPQEVQAALRGDNPRRYVGRRTTITVETLNNMELLIARARSAIDGLSPREHDVAALFANGANFRTIAGNLHIAPVTVRNHLRHIYAKLGISNKIELVRLLRGG